MRFNGTDNGHSWVSYSFIAVKLNDFNNTFSLNLWNSSIMHNDTTFLYIRNAVKQIEFVYGFKNHQHSVQLMSQIFTHVYYPNRGTWLATFVGKIGINEWTVDIDQGQTNQPRLPHLHDVVIRTGTGSKGWIQRE